MSKLNNENERDYSKPIALKCVRHLSVMSSAVETPTADLVPVRKGVYWKVAYTELHLQECHGYLVACILSEDVWWTPNDICLNTNFIYRTDLEITKLETVNDFERRYMALCIHLWNPHKDVRKACYILDHPVAGYYEPYYDSEFPSKWYGASTPVGTIVRKFSNRFERDAFILQLEEQYSNYSMTDAISYIGRKMEQDEVIIISDGCHRNGCCASSSWYLDSDDVTHMMRGFIPSTEKQRVIISEVCGVYSALQIAKVKGKKNITCYFDNTAVFDTLTYKQYNGIQEVENFRELYKELLDSGVKIVFAEIHPKKNLAESTAESAIMFLHKLCDRDCKEMTDIAGEKYRNLIAANHKITAHGKKRRHYDSTNVHS